MSKKMKLDTQGSTVFHVSFFFLRHFVNFTDAPPECLQEERCVCLDKQDVAAVVHSYHTRI